MKRAALAVVCVLGLVPSLGLDASSWKEELVKKLEVAYKPTHISVWDGALKQGYDTMVVTQAGVIAWPARDTGYPTTGVRDGRLIRARGTDTRSMARDFRKGEKVLIFDIKVLEDVDFAKDSDVIRLSLLSVEAVDRMEGGNTVSTRFKGGLDYQFPRGYLPTADFAEIKKAINTALLSEGEYQAVDTPATVRLGMTTQEVEQALGKPQKVLDLGAKKIFVYPDIKVTFVEGRVTDIQ